MRGAIGAGVVLLLSACVTPPAGPAEQAAHFGQVPPPPTLEQLRAAELLTNYVWESLPDPDDYVMVYPRDAWTAEAEAVLSLECLVLENRHVACAAGDDGWPQYDFEQAARNLSTLFVLRPLTRNGVAVEGRRIKLNVHFRLG